MSVVRTVADQFAEVLAHAGVKRIYGVAGDSLNDLTDAIRRQGKIEWICVRHEEVAAVAAGTEAHLTGLLAVCAGNCGTGNLHLVNGLFECNQLSIPLLAVAAHMPSAEIGGDNFQEPHPQTMFPKGGHHREFVSGSNRLPRAVEAAIRKAVGRRGVLLVMIPGDLAPQLALDVETALKKFVELLHARAVLAMPDCDSLLDAAEYLCNLGWPVHPSRSHRMKIDLIISADTLPLETERCWLLGLVVKELVANAVRHAGVFGTREGKISIELTWEGSFVHCAVSDNGPGMGRARPVRALRIAHYLAGSLGGRIGHWFDDEATSFVVTFPFTERELQENRTSGSRYASASH
jgi:hypothetical protein